MDQFENEELHQEREYTAPQPQTGENQPNVEQPYSGAGVGRKESPFANSPYVMNHSAGNYYNPNAGYVPPVPPEQPPVRKPKAKKRGGRKGWRAALCVMLALAVVAGSCGLTAALVNQHWRTQTQQMQTNFNTRLDTMQQQIDAAAQAAADAAAGQSVSGSPVSTTGLTPSQVYAQNVDSVVLITCQIVTSYRGQTATGTSAGSGFILTENGYVLTNNHVVDGASTVKITTYDGKEYAARVVGTDSVNDVAVLKVDTEDTLSPVTLGSSNDLIVGDQVVAIGNPLGELTSTMTVGYVSAKDRDVTTEGNTINMIQTDAAINSGNSGGPLFNMRGEVVGITTAKYSGSSSSGASIESIGFAIPIDDVIGMVDDFINYGYLTGAYLGVMVTDLDSSVMTYLGMEGGARIEEVTPGYCAEAAGLQAKDIIVDVGGYSVTNVSTLSRALRNFKAGDTTTITVYRSGQKMVFNITLDERPQEVDVDETPTAPDESQLPQDGSYEEWYDYFNRFFGIG